MDSLPATERFAPPLARRFQEPAGFRWGVFATGHGSALRWGNLPNPAADKACVLVGGFAEFIEKYFETARDFAARGFEVWCLDWHGQGASDRASPKIPTRPLARAYGRDADNLAQFIESMTPSEKPRLLVAHSMGAAIALLCLARHPKVVDAAALSAPMLGLPIPPVFHGILRAVARVATLLGFGEHFVPGAGPWTPRPDLCAATTRASNDPERCMLQRTWFEYDERLRLDGPTYGWTDAAFSLTARLKDKRLLREIATPILIGSARQERFVNPNMHRRAARFLPQAQLVEFPTAKHELFHEIDAVRDAWFAAIDAFVAQRLRGRHDD